MLYVIPMPSPNPSAVCDLRQRGLRSPAPVASPYDAMMLAADFIAAHPYQFAFSVCCSPTSSADFGCLVGWTAFFMGRYGEFCGAIHMESPLCVEIFGCQFDTLLRRIDELDPPTWHALPVTAARVLRLYAETYCRAPAAQLPAAVRAIIDQCAAQRELAEVE